MKPDVGSSMIVDKNISSVSNFSDGPAQSTAGFFDRGRDGMPPLWDRQLAAVFRRSAGSGKAQFNPTAGPAPLPKAEASRPHSKTHAADVE